TTVPIIGEMAAQATEPITKPPSGVIGPPRSTMTGGGLLAAWPSAGLSAPTTVAIASGAAINAAINAALAAFRMVPLSLRKYTQPFYTAIGRVACPFGSRRESGKAAASAAG